MRFVMGLIISLVVLVGCGKGIVDAEFQPYVDKFIEAGTFHGRNLSFHGNMQFGDVSGAGARIFAVCSNGSVTVDSENWKEASEVEREEVVFHELGHCVLGREHVETKHWDAVDFNAIPDSVMYPSRPHSGAYEVHREEYMRELFK